MAYDENDDERSRQLAEWEASVNQRRPQAPQDEAEADDNQEEEGGEAPVQPPTQVAAADFVGPQVPGPAPVASPGAYNGSAAAPPSFPGLPVLIEHNGFQGDNVTYNGQIMPSLQAAYAARAQHAADPQAQAAFARAQQQPQQVAEVDPSQMNSIQLQREYDRHQLSGPQRLEMTQLQTGIARLQADAREGRIPTAQAITLGQQLQARLQPMMITMEQAHGIQTALQIAHLREQVMHGQINNSRARAYDAAHGMTAQSSVRDSSGREIGVTIRHSDGSSHTVSVPHEPAQRSPARDQNQLTAVTLNQIHNDIERRVHAIMNPSGGRSFQVPDTFVAIPGESPELRRDRYAEDLIQRMVSARIRRLGGNPGQTNTMSQQEQNLQNLSNGVLGRIFGPGGNGSPQPVQPPAPTSPSAVPPPAYESPTFGGMS